MEICKYEGCEYPVNSPLDEAFCLFHAPSDKKGVEESTYNDRLNNHIGSLDYNFKGFIFPWSFTLRNSLNDNNIRKEVYFDDCLFEGNEKMITHVLIEEQVCIDFKGINFFKTVSFARAKFKNSAVFSNMITRNINLTFFDAKFYGNSYFRESTFNDSNVNFEKVQFKQTVDFSECRFIDNNENILHRKSVDFKDAEFQEPGKNGTTIFKKSEFSVRNLNFSNCKFHGKFFNFEGIKKLNCDTFQFTNAVIDSSVNIKNNIFHCSFILFNEVKFNSTVLWDDTEFNSIDKVIQSHLFVNTEFNDHTSFKNVTFDCGIPDFTKSIFRERTDFIGTKFRNGVNFTETKFGEFEYELNEEPTSSNNEKAIVFRPLLKTPEDEERSRVILFENVQFEGNKTSFIKCEYLNVLLSFEGNTFQSKLIFRENYLYGVSNIFFEKDYFYSDIEFIEFKFWHKCKIEIDFIDFSDRSFVTFENFAKGSPKDVTISNFNELEEKHKSNKFILIMFRNIKFPEHRTFFQKFNDYDIINDNFMICFRHSFLNNVYFTKNRMTMFSFYSSIFQSAIFTSNSWDFKIDKLLFIIPYKRKSLIFEDHIFSNWEMKSDYELLKLSDSLTSKKKNSLLDWRNFSMKFFIEIGENFDRNEVANLYRILKVSLDKAKDYRQAGYFYFNEFEMNRLALKDKKGIWNIGKYFSYSIYKIISGYGEKPFWSSCWLCISIVIISILNLFSGFKFKTDEITETVNYNFNFDYLSECLNGSWIHDFKTSILYTLSRAIPTGYLPISKENFLIFNSEGFMLSIFTTIWLLFLVIMVGVGVKRHFRRF